MSHDESHDDFLRALAVGEVDAGSDAARARLAGCPSCRASWDGIERARARLEGASEERRTILRAARSAPSSEVEDRVELALRREIARGSGEPGRRSARMQRGWLLAAAVLVLALGIVYTSVGRTPDEIPDVVLGDEVADLSPSGAVATYDGIVFTWVAELPAGGSFALQIEGRASGNGPWQPIVGPPAKLREARWEPASTLTSTWPAELRWRVTAYDVQGNPLADSSWQPLSRSR